MNAPWQMLEDNVIEGRYHLEQFLGAGGFGAVFRANEVVRDRLIRKLAIKLMEVNDCDLQLQELETALNVQHPNLIRCFSCGETTLRKQSFLFLLMELAEHSLAQRLSRGTLTTEETRQLLQDVAAGLAYLHAQQRVHRDLNPGNLFWAEGRWKIGDFGLTRQMGNGSQGMTSNLAGAPGFAPPEAYQGRFTPASDLWSLGIVAVYALTKNLPFNFRTAEELHRCVIDCDLSIPPLPNPLMDIVRGCLSSDPRRRWNATQVIAALSTASPSPSAPRQAPAPEQDDLSSERFGANYYANLRDLLKVQDWYAADKETNRAMCQVMDRQKEGWLRVEDIQKFPCPDLRNIDRLWVKYSNGRFGFSVQKQIYVECGATLDGKYPGDEIWRKFGDRVGWRKDSNWLSYSDLNPPFSSPQEIFPCWGVWWRIFFGGEWGWGYSSLARRLVDCNRPSPGQASPSPSAPSQAPAPSPLRSNLADPQPASTPQPTKPPVPPPPEEDDLSSERFGANYYAKLRDLLKTQDWKAADQETSRTMCEVMDRQKQGWLDVEHIQKFPCQDLRNIDRLWVKYSNGRFGFSVQKQIYVECGAKLDGKYPGDKIWEKFGDRVGWRRDGNWLDYSDLNPSLSSPQGIFPVVLACGGWGVWGFFSRAETCRL